MVTYTVHEREAGTQDIVARAEEIVFVKEGFAWLALVFPILWLLFHFMWIVLAGFVAIAVMIEFGVVSSGLSDGVAILATFALSSVLALQANDLRRWSLARKGYRLVELVSGRDRSECEERFFNAWLASRDANPEEAPQEVKPAQPATAVAGKTSTRTNTGGEDIIGLFPEPGK